MAWLNSGGTAGEEPPEALKEWHALSGEVQKYPMGSEEYQAAARRANQILLDNLWHVGIIGNMPKPTIIKTGLENTPDRTGGAHLSGLPLLDDLQRRSVVLGRVRPGR